MTETVAAMDTSSQAATDRYGSQGAERPLAVGIDFGTSQSCAGVYYGGKVVIIENDWANSTTPSCVAFTDSECLVGESARSQITRNPANTVMASKRLLGRSGVDPAISVLTKYWPVEVVAGGMRLKMRMEYKGDRKTFLPEELCSTIVTKMKKTVESFLGKQVTDVVVTVPTCSNYLQEKALIDACTFAGLNVQRVLEDTAAGAIAYVHEGHEGKTAAEKIVMILDIGAGHISVSVVTLTDGIVEVTSKCGSSTIGGEDFTARLVDHVVQDFTRKYHKNITSSSRAICRIRRACELAKRELSSLLETTIELETPMDGLDLYHVTISRDTFEALNKDHFQAVIELVTQAIKKSSLSEKDIHKVVLVGGSTQIPKIQALLQKFFTHLELGSSIQPSSMNPSEVMAFGATLHAAMLQGYQVGSLVLDCLSDSIGIELAGGEMCMLVRSGCTYPLKENISGCTTQCDNQSVVLFKIFKGERILTKDNTFLGRFALTGIPPAPRGVPQIELSVCVKRGSRLVITIQAVEPRSGRQAELTTTGDPNTTESSDGFEDIVPIFWPPLAT